MSKNGLTSAEVYQSFFNYTLALQGLTVHVWMVLEHQIMSGLPQITFNLICLGTCSDRWGSIASNGSVVPVLMCLHLFFLQMKLTWSNHVNVYRLRTRV
jgi:hypothetical protein